MREEIAFFRRLAAGSGRTLLAGSVVMGLEAALLLAVPWIIGSLAAALIARDEASGARLVTLFGALLAVSAGQALCSLAHQRRSARLFSEIVTDLRLRLYAHLQDLSFERRTELASGEATTLLGRDAEEAATFVTDFLSGVVPSVLTAVTAIALLIGLSPVHGAAAAIAVPAYLAAVRLKARQFSRLSRDLAAARAGANAVADDQLRLWQLARAFSAEPFMNGRYRAAEERAKVLGERLYLSVSALQPLTQLAAVGGVVALVWPMSGRVILGTLSADTFVRFLLYALVLSRSMGSLAGLYGVFQRGLGSASRLASVSLALPERRTGIEIPHMTTSLALSDVTFAYEGRAPVFDGLNLTIRKGELVILTGPNGSGKSTLVKLLLGVLEPASGRIRIDGVDLSGGALSALRKQIAWVPQETALLRGTVRDNILLGRQPEPGALERALELAGARELVSGLPGGLDALVGEGGVNLSGGERQRLALARALLSDLPILLLDEATSMIDLVTEAELVARLEAFRGHRTVVLVSHRVPRIAAPHRVVCLEQGRVAAAPVSVVA